MWYDVYMKITLYGFGYVGRALFEFFKDHFEIQVYDPNIDVSQLRSQFPGHNFLNDFDALEKTKHALIAVPTPMRDDGSCDTSIVIDTLKKSQSEFHLIKSTVPPGTTEFLISETGKKICFSPEYIGEGKYIIQWWKDRAYPHPTDMKYHDFQIFGGEKDVTSEFIQIFQKVVGPDVKYMQTNSRTAELTKYMVNSWGAMKVTFCNEFFEIAKAFGVDYNELRELFLLDGRTERMHTSVFPDARGFGGKCFPKDVNAIVKATEAKGYHPDLIKEVLSSNKKFRNE